MNTLRSGLRAAAVFGTVLLAPQFAPGAETVAPTPNGAAAAAITPAETDQAKQIFASQCGWCHGDYGHTADKGPKLAGTKMTTQQVEERIHNGKPGYMPSFKHFLDDQQIALMAKYIKSLKP